MIMFTFDKRQNSLVGLSYYAGSDRVGTQRCRIRVNIVGGRPASQTRFRAWQNQQLSLRYDRQQGTRQHSCY